MSEVGFRPGESVDDFLRRVAPHWEQRRVATDADENRGAPRREATAWPHPSDRAEEKRPPWARGVARGKGGSRRAIPRALSAGARAALWPLDFVSGFTRKADRALLYDASDREVLDGIGRMQAIRHRQAENAVRGGVGVVMGAFSTLAFGALYALESFTKTHLAGVVGESTVTAAAAADPTGVFVSLAFAGAAAAFILANRNGRVRLDRRVARATEGPSGGT